MRQIRNTAVMEALSEKVRAFGIKAAAPEVDKEPSSLYAELNPYGDQSKAKLSLDDSIELMRLVKDVSALELAAASLGYRLCPMHADPDKETVAEEIADIAEAFGKMSAACMNAATSQQTVHLLAAEVHQQVDEAEAAKRRGRRT